MRDWQSGVAKRRNYKFSHLFLAWDCKFVKG